MMQKLAMTLLFLSSAIAAQAGVVFEVETKDHETGTIETVSAYAEGKNLKMEIASSADETQADDTQADEVIYRGDRREMMVVDHKEKSYMVMDLAYARQIGERLNQISNPNTGLIAQAMQNMSPEQRKALADAMAKAGGAGANPLAGMMPGQGKPKAVRVVNTGQRGVHLGHATVRYDIFKGDMLAEQVWATKASSLTGGTEMLAAFTGLADFQNELGEQFGAEESAWFASITKLDGRFPVAGKSFEGGELEDEFTLKSVSERDLDPDAFEPPKGYRLRTMGPQ